MNPYSTELRHHGILGQRWGKKNGPPYPLDAESHSASEKVAGYAKSIKKTISKKSKELVSKAKETIKDPNKRRDLINKGKIAAAVAITAVGTYAIIKNELRPVTKTTIMPPMYGAGGKMLYPSYAKSTTVPNYISKGHTSVNNVMKKVGKGFDMTKLTIDELKQLDLY